MSDVFVGILAVLAGLMLCFRGYWTLRLVLGIWGAVIGFGLGATLATWINDDSYLASALGWIIGLVLALMFALLAYLYYAIGVILSLGSMGFVLGAAVTGALGVEWDWVIIGVGVVCGLAVALLAIAADVPMVLLVVLSSLSGATVLIAGVMLLTGVLNTADFDQAAVTENIDGHWYWTLGFAALAVVGILSQLNHVRGLASARQGWDASARRTGA